jgi:death-on-curing protein
MTQYLELDDLVRMIAVARLDPIRDAGLLESALARPQTTLMGAEAYPRLDHKAAALLHSLVKNHALFDGNKRLGWLAAVVFIGFNGHRVQLSQTEAFDLTWAVADGSLSEIPDIAARLPLVER